MVSRNDMVPKFDKKLVTRPLLRSEAELLHGSCWKDGKMQTVDEIMADPNMSKLIQCRDIDTGEMKLADEHHNQTGIPFFVYRVS